MATTEDQLSETPRTSRTRQRTWIEVLAAATAILLFATAILGLIAARTKTENVDLSGTVSDLTAQVEANITTLRSDNSSLEADNTKPKADIAALRSQTPPDDAGSPVSPPGAPAVRNSGQIVIGDEHLDLDAKDAKWGATLDGYPDHSLSAYTSHVEVSQTSVLRLPGGAPANYASCSGATGYKEAFQLSFTELDGPNVCLKLSNDRILTLQHLGHTEDTATFKLTSWELP